MEAIDGAIERDVELLKAVAHPLRLVLLEALSQSEVCVCHLSTLVGKPQPYVSKQLAELREAGLVLDRRDGQRIYYRLADPRLAEILAAVRNLTGRPPLRNLEALLGCPCPRCS